MFQEAAQSVIDDRAAGSAANQTPGAEGGMPDESGEGAATTTDTSTTDTAASTEENKEGATTAAAAAATTTTDTSATTTTATEPINFEGISKGVIKSVDDIAGISDELVRSRTELQQLREQVAKSPFANELVKTINQMYADGKTETQIDTLLKLQKLGDISKLPPLQAMIEARVLRDGRAADVTQKMLERKYGITDDMDELDRQIAEETMKDDAKADYEYLAGQKKELATPTKATSDTTAAAQVLSHEAIRQQVEPIKGKIKDAYTSLGEINLNGKVDKDGKPTADAILFNMPVPSEFKEQIPDIVEGFYNELGVVPDKENLEILKGVINHNLYEQYGVKLIQDAVNAFAGPFEKKIRAEYEHKGKLENNRINQSATQLQLEDADLKDYVSGV